MKCRQFLDFQFMLHEHSNFEVIFQFSKCKSLIDSSRCRLYVRIYRLYLKLSKMLTRKKNTATPSKQHQSSSKISLDSKVGVRKNYQKHFRKGTKDYQSIDLLSLATAKLYKSEREATNQTLMQNINSIIFGYTTPFSLDLKEALVFSNTKEHLNAYCILSKHRNEYLDGKLTIQSALVEVIQGKNSLQFISKPNMHFQGGIYRIMSHHMMKRKRFIKKIISCQAQSSVHKQPTKWTKELPTLVSYRDREDSDIFDRHKYDHSGDRKNLNTSESFQLKKLTECIKDMFNKQIFQNPREKIMVWTGGKNSWLLGGRSIDKKTLLECDYSSIHCNSKYEIQVEQKVRDAWATDVEQNYGLGTLRRKYEEQKISKLKQSSEVREKKVALGHKRNPTQIPLTKEHFLVEPMTPKQSCRSVFSSTQNIAMNSPKDRKSKSRKKDFQINENYLVRFQKKKQPSGVVNLKENAHREKSKAKNQSSKSRSKEKLKFTTKKK